MMGDTHKRMGATTAIVATAALLPTTLLALVLIPAAWLTSKLPDKAENAIPWLMPWRWRIQFHAHVLPWRWLTIRPRPLDHRRVTHYPETIIPACALASIAAFTSSTLLGMIVTGLALGVVMHLVADAMTITGLPSFVNTRRGKPHQRLRLFPAGYRIHTGQNAEHWFRRGWTVACLALAAGIYILHRQDTPSVDPLVIVAVGVGLALLTSPARHLLRVQRIKHDWTRAVILAGATDPPGKFSRKQDNPTGPKLTRVQPCAAGYKGTVKISKSNSFQNLEKHRQEIGNNLDRRGLKIRDLRLESNPDRMSRATATIVLRDPFAIREPIQWDWLKKERTSLWDPIPFGVDEEGHPVHITLPYRSVLIGGQPDSGKSVALQILVAAAALDPDARLWLFDGKGEIELAAWAAGAEQIVGGNGKDAIKVLQHIDVLLTEREADLKGKARKVEPGMNLPFHVIVLDEIATYMQLPDPKENMEIERLLLRLIQKGRALGFIPIFATQKPHGEILSTNIRDLISLRLALSCNTPQASNTILGDGWAGQGYNAATISIDHPGVGYLRTTGTPTKIRTPYLTDDDLEALASRAAAHRIDQEQPDWLNVPAPSPTPPTPKSTEQREQRDRAMLAEGLPSIGQGLDRDEVLVLLKAKPSEWKRVKPILDAAVKSGLVECTGAGKPGDRFRWRLRVQPLAREDAQG